MTFLRIAALALLSIGAGQALAQSWAKEPAAVFGIPLGDGIGAGTFEKCEAASQRNNWGNYTAPCLDRFGTAMATLRGLDLGQVSNQASIFFEDAVVSAVHVNTDHSNYLRLKAMLIERYGPPSASSSETVTSRAGASVPAETLSWRGRQNSIILFERYGSIDKSIARFYNNEAEKRTEERINTGIKAGASKF